jgi:6-phosphogluconolactonase
MLEDNWFIFEDIDKLSEQLANDVLDIAKSSIKSNDSFKIVLTGGKTILNTYRILSNSESDWRKWHVYLGDERCLPIGDKGRNNHIINQVWLNNSKILKKNIHFIDAELDVTTGAAHYENILSSVAGFDVTLLSMGEDGHAASLFPGHLYDTNKSVVIERNSPKYPKERISMSYSRLNYSKNIFKVINGSSKQRSLGLWLKGVELPINQISGVSNKIYLCKNTMKSYLESMAMVEFESHF